MTKHYDFRYSGPSTAKLQMYIVQCTVYTVHVQCTLCNVHCTCALYTVQCTPCNKRCTMYTVHFKVEVTL